MARIICTRENASELISGVKFSLHKDKGGAPVGMISDEISDAQAEQFLEISGYELVDEEPAPAPAPAPAKAAAAPTPAAPKAPTRAEKAAAEKAAAAEAEAKAAAEKEATEKAAAEKAAADTQSSDSTPPADNAGQKPEGEEETF